MDRRERCEMLTVEKNTRHRSIVSLGVLSPALLVLTPPLHVRVFSRRRTICLAIENILFGIDILDTCSSSISSSSSNNNNNNRAWYTLYRFYDTPCCRNNNSPLFSETSKTVYIYCCTSCASPEKRGAS